MFSYSPTFPTQVNHYVIAHLQIIALWSPSSLTPIHSLTDQVGQPFASRLGGAAARVPVVHPHLQLEPGSPVSDVWLQPWPFCSTVSGCHTAGCLSSTPQYRHHVPHSLPPAKRNLEEQS
jgi:hypothetical protein